MLKCNVVFYFIVTVETQFSELIVFNGFKEKLYFLSFFIYSVQEVIKVKNQYKFNFLFDRLKCLCFTEISKR